MAKRDVAGTDAFAVRLIVDGSANGLGGAIGIFTTIFLACDAVDDVFRP